MVPPRTQPESSQRASNACRRCRLRKVKCTGTNPCDGCARRHLECVYDSDGRKVLISERYLRELERASRPPRRISSSNSHVTEPDPTITHIQPPADHSNQPRPLHEHTRISPLHVADDGDGAGNESDTDLRNPLSNSTASYVLDASGRLRALGESSTWSFSRRIFALARDLFPHPQSPVVALNEQGSTYVLNWNPPIPTDLGLHGLPSVDYAVYLTNAVNFHIGQTFHLFDTDLFMQQIQQFYASSAHVTGEVDRLWYVQFLLVLAFGKALVVHEKVGQSPPGSEFFTKAMSLLPDFPHLYRDSSLTVEILCSVSLYLQSIDQRNAAYIYIGQALRMSLTFGLHRERPNDQFPRESHNRCRFLWWTVYILDRKFSSSMGVPTSIQDHDITASLPSSQDNTKKAAVITYHVKLSMILAQVVDKVYGPNGRLHSRFLSSVQSVLEDAAVLGKELERHFPVTFNEPTGSISRAAASLNISYHHIILLATFPLLYCLFDRYLHDLKHKCNTRRGLSGRTQALLWTSAQSAKKIVRIVSVLRREHLLETFLPFDLEHLFSASFVLILVSIVHPDVVDTSDLVQEAYLTLEYMTSKGNALPGLRRAELTALESFGGLLQHADRTRLTSQDESRRDPVLSEQQNQTHDNTNSTSLDFEQLNATSPNQLLSIAQLLPLDGDYPTQDEMWLDGWVWHEPTSMPEGVHPDD